MDVSYTQGHLKLLLELIILWLADMYQQVHENSPLLEKL
jgi:hypothetical protein